jgi:presenilin-like A22 family membrane protease
MVIYASLIYLTIFLLAASYKQFVITPTSSLLLSNSLSSSQRSSISNNIVAVGQSQAQSPGANQNTVETLTAEIIILSIFAILEMKFHLISRLAKIWWVRLLFFALPVLLLAYIAIYALGLALGLALTGLAIAAIIGVYIVVARLTKKYMLAGILICFTFMICYLLLAPTSNLLTSSPNTQLIINIIYMALMVVCAVCAMWELGHSKSLKNLLNLMAAISCISFSIYFGMIINVVYIAILLAIFTCYDFIAVFITKHMQFMGGKLVSQMVPAMFMWGDEKELNEKLKKLGEGKPIAPPKKGPQKSNSILLGSGDIALPSAAFCSALFYAPKLAPFMLLGTIVGITICGFALSSGKSKIGWPALIFLVPFLLLFAGIGLIL